jgi:hypothetical protein
MATEASRGGKAATVSVTALDPPAHPALHSTADFYLSQSLPLFAPSMSSAAPSSSYLPSPSRRVTGSGIPESVPISTYRPYVKSPVPIPRPNYPTDSFTHSRESNIRTTILTNLPQTTSRSSSDAPLAATAFDEKGKDLGLKNIVDRTARDESLIPDVKLPKDANGKIVMPPHQPKSQSLLYRTTSNQFGLEQPEVYCTQEFRYFPRAHNFTKNWTGNYKSWGLAI